ncbi:MAG: type IV pilus assembly protein PilM [Luteitalea sp.]|nr:type IV pilus assembly protein PilM [Luteitalea sp.]
MWRRIRGHVVGLDVGASAVRLLELKRRRTGVGIRAYGCAPLPEEAMGDADVLDDAAVLACLQPLVQTLPLSTRRVAIGLAGRDLFVTRLVLPRLSPRELRTAIRWEARAQLPFDLDEVALDYQALPDSGSEPSRMAVVLAAAHQRTIEWWQSLVTRAGLQLGIVDVVPFAVQRACEWLGVTGPGEVVLLLHIGTRATAACLVREGHPLFVGDLAIGGDAWTAAIAREARCTRQEAEALKRNVSCGSSPAPADWPPALAIATETFATELARMLAFAREHDDAPAPQRVVLSGGGAHLAGLGAVLSARLGCHLEVFGLANARINGLLTAPPPDLGPAWALAMGLALRGVSR